MDEALIRYYRQLLKADFPHAGEIEAPTVFVEAVGERLIHCGNTGNYMQLYLLIAEERIAEIRYLCSCEPAANVAVEVLCGLVKGRTLAEAAALDEEAFYREVGSREAEFAGKVQGILALFNEGLGRRGGEAAQGSDGEPRPHLTWDRSYSP
jgi:NifU-like protein involved in Fe-S cluster formation